MSEDLNMENTNEVVDTFNQMESIQLDPEYKDDKNFNTNPDSKNTKSEEIKVDSNEKSNDSDEMEKMIKEAKEEGVKKNEKDENKYLLSDIFGEESVTFDEIKGQNLITKGRDYDKLQKENDLLKSKLNIVNQNVQKVKNPFTNDNVMKFNQFVADTKIDSYDIFKTLQNVNLEGKDDIYIVALSEYIKDPEVTDLSKEIRLANKKFRQGDFIPKETNEEGDEILKPDPDDKAYLEKEANRARKELKGFQEKIELYKKDDIVDFDKQSNEVSKAWDDLVPRFVDNIFSDKSKIKNIPITYKQQNGEKKVTGYFTLDDSHKEDVEKIIKYVASNVGDMPTKENIGEHLDLIMNQIKFHYFDEIMQVAQANAKKEAIAFVIKKSNNVPSKKVVNNLQDDVDDVPDDGVSVDEAHRQTMETL